MLKITRNGQITIPKNLRDEYSLHEGDYVEVSVTSEGILLKPVQAMPRKMTMTQIVERAKKDLASGTAQTLTDAESVQKLIDSL